MLEQLMVEIRAGGTLEAAKLAARLKTSPQMVEAMLEHLRRAGLLQIYEACGDGCGTCGLKQNCDPAKKQAGVQIWQYNE
jgi:DNA-binding IscR family transcriptional regulator